MCPNGRSSEREPADSLRDKSNVIGGWLPSLTFFVGRRGGEGKSRFKIHEKPMKRVFIIISTSVLVLITVLGLLALLRPGAAPQELSEVQLLAKVQSNLVNQIAIRPASVATNAADVRGTFYLTDATGQRLIDHGMPKASLFHATVHLTPDLEVRLLRASNVTVIEPLPLFEKVRTLVHRSN